MDHPLVEHQASDSTPAKWQEGSPSEDMDCEERLPSSNGETASLRDPTGSDLPALQAANLMWFGPQCDDSGKITGGIIDPDFNPSDQPIDVQFYLYLLGTIESASGLSFDQIVRRGATSLSRYRDANQGLYITQMTQNRYWDPILRMQLQYPWPPEEEYRILALGALGSKREDDRSSNDERGSQRPMSGRYGSLCDDAVLTFPLKDTCAFPIPVGKRLAGRALVKTNIRAPIPSWIDRQHYTDPVEFATLVARLYDPNCHMVSVALDISSTYCDLSRAIEQRDLFLLEEDIVCHPDAEDEPPDRYWLLDAECCQGIFGRWWEYASVKKRPISPGLDRDAKRLERPMQSD